MTSEYHMAKFSDLDHLSASCVSPSYKFVDWWM
jgi:hypothetical protein